MNCNKTIGAILALLLLASGFSADAAVTNVAGANVDTARPPDRCVFSMSLEQTYTHNVQPISALGAAGFAIDTKNQRGYIGLQQATTTGRVDRITINPLGVDKTGPLITSAAGASRPAPAVNIPQQVLADALMDFSIATHYAIQLRDLDMNLTGGTEILAPAANQQGTVIGDQLGLFYSMVFTTIAGPIIHTAMFASDGTSAVGTDSGTTVDTIPLAVSTDGTLVYGHHCTGSGGPCNPTVDWFSTHPLTLLGTGGIGGAAEVPAGLAIDKTANTYYVIEVANKRLDKVSPLNTNTITATYSDAAITTAGMDSVVLDFAHDKIYFAWTDNLGQLNVSRLNKTTFALEQKLTMAGAFTTGSIHGSVQLDPVFEKLYVAGNNGTTPQIRQIKLCA